MIQGIAKKAGITQAALLQMEKADNELRTATLEKFANAMGLNVISVHFQYYLLFNRQAWKI